MTSNTLISEFDFDFQIPKVENVADYILQQVQIFSEIGREKCITNCLTEETFLYKDIGPMSQRVTSAFLNRGMKKGDTVLYSSHDGAKLHLFLLGIWQAGGIVRSSYPEDFGDELVERILESKIKWIFCDEQYAAQNLKATTKIPWPVEVIVSGTAIGCTPVFEFFNKIDNANPENLGLDTKKTDIALILPTSGTTTGRSKGAIYTHETLLKNIIILQYLPFIDNSEEPFLLTSRLTHFTGTVFPLAFFSAGRNIMINPQPNKQNIFQAISSYKIRGILAFPKFLLCLANDPEVKKHDISSLKFAVTAGQVVGPSFISSVKSIPSLENLLIIYGMTEVGLLTVNADWNSALKGINKSLDEFPPFSCGKLAPGNQLRVKDLQTGEFVKANQVGELYFRSPFNCNGYFNHTQANEETFENGWIRTGDVGYFDENGFIYLKDRIKEIFKYFNNHICPSELENVLMNHPAVAFACVIGITDPEGGDMIPRAFVEIKEKCIGSITASEIRTYHDENVASYKRLRGGLFITKLPVGKTGKILKSVLQAFDVSSVYA